MSKRKSVNKSISKSKYMEEYYEKNKSKINKIFAHDKYSPKKVFEAYVNAYANNVYPTKAAAKEAMDDIVYEKQYGIDAAEIRRALKKSGKKIDFRRKEYRASDYSIWQYPESDILVEQDTGDWNGGVTYDLYLDSFSVNLSAGIVLARFRGIRESDASESPIEGYGTYSIQDFEKETGIKLRK